MSQPMYRAPLFADPCDALPAYIRAVLVPRTADDDAVSTELSARFAEQAREADARRQAVRDGCKRRVAARGAAA